MPASALRRDLVEADPRRVVRLSRAFLAHVDGWPIGSPIGMGSTREEALRDLAARLEIAVEGLLTVVDLVGDVGDEEVVDVALDLDRASVATSARTAATSTKGRP